MLIVCQEAIRQKKHSCRYIYLDRYIAIFIIIDVSLLLWGSFGR